MSANNLPIQVTSFVGRVAELTELAQLLPATRLLTLAGAGGTGKTRLALQLAANVLDSPSAGSGLVIDDGVWFIDLGPLSDPALVPLTIASVLGVRAEPGRPLTATLLDWLRPKNLILILDNCEHLIDACAELADAVLHSSRETRILATSREALGIAGELAWRVPSLACPTPLDERVGNLSAHTGSLQNQSVNEYAAVQLFIARAKFANAKFGLTDANATAVAQICYRLDGIPLAIELAAARVKSMRVEQIAERLDDRFRLLTGSRTALRRHQTLGSLIDWSHGLLPEAERVLLRRLSVFAGGLTLEAAEEVCKDEGGRMKAEPLLHSSFILHPSDVLDLLNHLVDKSLVVLEEQAAEPRYRMLETIRQYAHEKLLEAGESERLHDNHRDFFQKLAERTEALLNTAQRVEWIPRLNADNDNLRTALDWACERDPEAARAMAGRLSNYWYHADRATEARTWYERVLGRGDRAVKTEGMALALYGAGWIAGYLLALDDAEPLLEQSIALWQVLDDKARFVDALCWLCFVKIHQGESELACAMFEANESTIRRFADPQRLSFVASWWPRALATARGDPGGARLLLEQIQSIGRNHMDAAPPVLHNALGYLATQQGDYALAKQHMLESLSHEQRATPASFGLALGRVADVTYLQGDYAEAGILYDEASAMFKAVGDVAHFAHILTGAGFIAVQQGELARATAIFSESLEILRKGQFQVGTARCLVGYAALMLAQGLAEQAVRLLASETVRSRSYQSHIPIDRIRYERTLAAARAQLDDPQFNMAWADGSHFTLEQTIAEARHAAPTVDKAPGTLRPPRDPNTLTARELEVLRLVADGLSNAQIAAQLVISHRTVQTHLTSVYGKFAVDSRSAATRYAHDHKLL